MCGDYIVQSRAGVNCQNLFSGNYSKDIDNCVQDYKVNTPSMDSFIKCHQKNCKLLHQLYGRNCTKYLQLNLSRNKIEY